MDVTIAIYLHLAKVQLGVWMQEKPTLVLVLLGAWIFWFVFFLGLGI